ncbi:PSD1 and planctomycete cytochrome C domain-containing protein [Tautonia plasticadhaerens]|nr:PSD1 and planctomycete cytochrome C domain-containing protein [Tautonia plasticadhaerens]
MLAIAAALASPSGAQEAPPADDPRAITFFETRIRPILVERCLSCHGPEEQEAGLRLDSRPLVFEVGGDSGPPVLPGDPDGSLLIEAIRYDSYVQMPPSSKLPDDEIARLTEWVAMGAPWPPEASADGEAPSGPKPFDLEARARHWSLQPVVDPVVPVVERADWPRNPVDRFLLARLESEGLDPSPEADRRTLIRRATFDLTGLPPTREEIAAFLADDRADAFDRLVARLLASPRYGERWARHWLDLVRFAETSGHEFDYDILTAHRYRDYIIRALNDDLPYDRFVVEHLAGDLLDRPRRHPTTGTDEAILGTMSFFLAEGTHSPVDVREEMRTRVDNQIDVLGKAFLGLTVACARCHDHKFDAIGTRDYYALAGHFQTARHQYAFIDPPHRIDDRVLELQSIRSALAAEFGPGRAPAAGPPRLREGDELFADFAADSFDAWYPAGQAFGDRPTRHGDLAPDPDGDLARLEPGWAHSGAIAPRLQGVLRSETFAIDRPFLHVLAAGSGGRINLVVDGFEKIRSPIYGGLTLGVDLGDAPGWVSMDVSMWDGHLAHLELADGASSNYTGATSSFWPGDGTLAVALILASDHREPPGPASEYRSGPVLDRIDGRTIPEATASLLDRYRQVAEELPEPTLALAAAEGTGIDVPVHVRGSSKNLGEVVPRRFLEVLDPEGKPPADDRLTLARRVASAENPLTARVLVNRLWAHHFSRGIVASPDDFGAMGVPPTHPELLDWLASEFVRSGWSTKHMHRLMMTSTAYRMSSKTRPEADRADPTNALLHRMNLRRLEAEAIRDALLALSGRLDPTMFGPSVPPHLSPFMEGRGRPKESGPIDGDGRRSLYLDVRRNFLPPLLLAFDFPTPSSTRGRRDTSNVPSQALALMNDPFIVEQSRRWAGRATGSPDRPPAEVVDALYESAYGRAPTEAERDRAVAFVREQSDAGRAGRDAWADLCHALVIAKEFRYVE